MRTTALRLARGPSRDMCLRECVSLTATGSAALATTAPPTGVVVGRGVAAGGYGDAAIRIKGGMRAQGMAQAMGCADAKAFADGERVPSRTAICPCARPCHARTP